MGEQRSGYTVSLTSTAKQGVSYVVVSPAGVPLYTFSDGPTAMQEAAVLNTGRGQLVETRGAPRAT